MDGGREGRDQGVASRAISLGRALRALSSRNYRLFFSGQSISLIGTWMQRLAMGWLVYHLTASKFLLGAVSFVGLFPVFLLSAVGGVVADRANRHHLLVATQVLAMAQALVLTFLVMRGQARIEYLMLLAAALGLINAFDTPIRQAFTVEMVEKKEDLGNAIALNSAIFNGARLLGPSIAGLTIAVLGVGLCFLLNGLSYLAVIAALLMMKIAPHAKARDKQNMFGGLSEGFRYAAGFSPIRSILLLLAVVSITGMPYMVLMPVFAKDILHGGPHTLGFLMGAAGGGALAGAIYLAWRKTVVGLESVVPAMTALFGLGLVGFSLSQNQWLSMLLLLVAGFGMMVQTASSNTILQTIVDEDKRGRVMSLYVMFNMGTAPFGSLLAGIAAARFGASETVLWGGVLCLVTALLFSLKLRTLEDLVRPIYIEKGILTDAALLHVETIHCH